MATGPELIDAIKAKHKLTSVNNCPGVPVAFGHALYGSVQNDIGQTTIESQLDINKAIGFSGSNGETAVYHFETKPTHHFVVVPWYDHGANHGQVYSVFMAYEQNYDVDDYIKKTGKAPNGANGYRDFWTIQQLMTMLGAIALGSDEDKEAAWRDYFAPQDVHAATSMTYCKYAVKKLDTALTNIGRY